MITKYLNLKYFKSSSVILFAIFLTAFILRVIYLPQNAISFAYDQARDAFVVKDLLSGHIKILGPSVSGVPGLFHGVLYYYVIAPAYFFGHGNPVWAAYYLSFISSAGVFVIYLLTKFLIKDKTPAYLAAIFFAFSFESTQYANLLTNASMAAWFVPISYLGLYIWTHKNEEIHPVLYKYSPVIAGIGLGFTIQSEVALAYHIIPIVFWLFYFRNNIDKKQIYWFVTSFLLSVSTMIIAEVKFNFTGIKGLIYLLSGKDGIANKKELADYFLTLANQSGKTFAYTLFPVNIVMGGVVGFIIVWLSLRSNFFWSKYLVSCIFAYALALPFGGWNMRHILVGVAPAICVLTAIFIWKYLHKYKIIYFAVILIILTSNLSKIISENKYGQTIFPLQKDLTLANEISLVDYTYLNSTSDKTFSISTLTSPLFVNTLWSYIYNWHGVDKYGYLPSWVGRDQVGQLGNNLKSPDKERNKHYFIVEPTYGIPEIWVTYAHGDADSISETINTKRFGELIVEERVVKK